MKRRAALEKKYYREGAKGAKEMLGLLLFDRIRGLVCGFGAGIDDSF
jgi:hypothetical protein